MHKLLTVLSAPLVLILTRCGYSIFQTSDEQIKASSSELVNQCQRRADRVSGVFNAVKVEA